MTSGFAVIDLETTGFSYQKTDRIIEIGIVLLDINGEVEGEWETLVNPKRDLGKTSIHGVEASDVLGAPEFSDIIGDIISLIEDRVLVAHNASFEMNFLRAEFERAGFDFPVEDAFCTMQASRNILPIMNHKLATCCESVGVELIDAHTAIGDARATAGLLKYLLQYEHVRQNALSLSFDASSVPLGYFPEPQEISVPRGSSDTSSSLVDYLFKDRQIGAASVATKFAYLDFLYEALLDGEFSLRQKRRAAILIAELQLTRNDVIELNKEYLVQMYYRLKHRGVDDALDILRSHGESLGVSNSVIGDISSGRVNPQLGEWVPRFTLNKGDKIVFTGDSDDKPHLISLAEKKGLIVASGMSKAVKAVFADNEDSLSTKATKAEEYGIPIISIASAREVFERELPSTVRSKRASSAQDTTKKAYPSIQASVNVGEETHPLRSRATPPTGRHSLTRNEPTLQDSVLVSPYPESYHVAPEQISEPIHMPPQQQVTPQQQVAPLPRVVPYQQVAPQHSYASPSTTNFSYVAQPVPQAYAPGGQADAASFREVRQLTIRRTVLAYLLWLPVFLGAHWFIVGKRILGLVSIASFIALILLLGGSNPSDTNAWLGFLPLVWLLQFPIALFLIPRYARQATEKKYKIRKQGNISHL